MAGIGGFSTGKDPFEFKGRPGCLLFKARPGEYEAGAQDTTEADFVGGGIPYNLDCQQVLTVGEEGCGEVIFCGVGESPATGSDQLAVQPDAGLILKSAHEEANALVFSGTRQGETMPVPDGSGTMPVGQVLGIPGGGVGAGAT